MSSVVYKVTVSLQTHAESGRGIEFLYLSRWREGAQVRHGLDPKTVTLCASFFPAGCFKSKMV